MIADTQAKRSAVLSKVRLLRTASFTEAHRSAGEICFYSGTRLSYSRVQLDETRQLSPSSCWNLAGVVFLPVLSTGITCDSCPG